MTASVGLCWAYVYYAHHQLVSFMLVFSLLWCGLKWNSLSNSPTLPRTLPPDTVFITTHYSQSYDLGAQMFKYASLLGVAKENHLQPVMPSDYRLFNLFTLEAWPATTEDIANMSASGVVYREACGRKCYNEGTMFLADVNNNATIIGDFQSFKYFEEAEDDVRRNFHIKPAVSTHIGRFYSLKAAFGAKKHIRVGIHLETASQSLHSLEAFATRGFQYFRAKYPRIQYVVASDNLSWAKSSISALMESVNHTDVTEANVETHKSGVDILFAPSSDSFLQMALLAECDHVMFCGGATAWWAAWLAGGDTLYCDEQHSNPDYYLPHWKPM